MADRAKYIIVEVRGIEIPIVFSSLISHVDIGRGNKVISAGFCEVMGKETEDDEDNISVWAGGKSVTLKLESREKDAALIQRMLRNQITW